MSELQPTVLSEADEQLFQTVRSELLGKPDVVAPTAEAAPPAADLVPQATRRSGLSWIWFVLVLIAVVVTAVGWLLPEEAGDLKQVGMGMLVVIGIGLLLSRVLQKAADRKAQAPSVPASPWRRFLVSFVWFVLIGVALFTPLELAWLIGVLLLHETGHFLGMRYFGYRDVQMFFIPLFGAAVRGEKKGVPGWQEAVILLLGPLPGLVLGCGIYFLDLYFPQPVLRTGAAWLVALNFLNLLPFEPLDGGRLCNRLLFSRHRWLEVITLVLATIGLVFLCFGTNWICLGLSGLFAILVLAPNRYKTATAALALQTRWPDLPLQLSELSEEQLRDLFMITRREFATANAKLLPGLMKVVHARALLHPESGQATLIIFAIYLGAILLGVMTSSMTHLRDDAGRLPIMINRHVNEALDQQAPPKAK